MRYGLIIGFAAIIDAVQLMLGLGTFAMQIIPVIGQGAAVLAGVIDEVISFAFGAAFIVALVFTGMFSWGAVLGGSMVEMVPFLNMLAPGWTLMAWRCVANDKAKARARQPAAIAETVEETPSPRPVDGIRAANDNYYDVQIAA